MPPSKTLGESDTRAKLIDPALHERGWTEEFIRREETAGAIDIIAGKAKQRDKGRVDYTLRVKVSGFSQPVAVALIEAKAEVLPPAHGLEQAKAYASAKRMNVPYVFSSNGHLFVEYDSFTGLTTKPVALSAFPTPEDLRLRYEQKMGFHLSDEAAAPLLVPYPGGETSRRYYQDAAIRATLEKLARGQNRALLSLATGSGKTFIAVHLLKKIADAGQIKRALFVCDRDELRQQALGALQNVFGSDAAPVSSKNPQKNARVLVATYQTLNLDSDEADANFLLTHYPPDYFSHIVIDECHRSAWGRWSQVLLQNPNAVQIGLTATPRQIQITERTAEAFADRRISADNLAYFGEPVYEYEISQGIEDGYLAACEIVRRDIFLEHSLFSERESGLAQQDLAGKRITDAITGEVLAAAEAKAHYSAPSFEERLIMPDRVSAMANDLFQCLLDTGGPEQKTIVFCASDHHADDVAMELNNLYAAWCQGHGRARLADYAFKCTAASSGGDYLPDLRAGSRHHFIATTVDLLTTGVDVPVIRNVVFFKYVGSPIAFYQMIGRGTRLDPATGKLMFRVYDYTNATRLLPHGFITKAPPVSKPSHEPPKEPERTIKVEGDGGPRRGGRPLHSHQRGWQDHRPDCRGLQGAPGRQAH
ncbi:MAG TPA: DEAD/DEAH box helicase family protein [Chloroflexota bacterium]|nr:DEAD/DEAH box helicase family protein [Chloroflexota bacterium]